MQDLKLLEAIQTSWDHVSMIVGEGGGLKAKVEIWHLTLEISCRPLEGAKFLYPPLISAKITGNIK